MTFSANVVTTPGDPTADPKVLVYSALQPEFPIDESSDSNYHEKYKSAPLPPGTYLVQIRWSPDYMDAYTPAQRKYNAAMWVR